VTSKCRRVRQKKYRPKRTPPLEINVAQLDGIVDKAYSAPLSRDEGELLRTSIHAMAERLKRKYEPRTTEKSEHLIGSGSDEEAAKTSETTTEPPRADEKKPRRGHGRNGAADYTGATIVPVPHSEVTPKCLCPDCEKGKTYDMKGEHKPLIRITGMSPIQATIYQLQRLRCNLCGRVYEAEPPPGVGDEKYDATVSSMTGQLRYGSGMPFNRIEKLQAQVGIPLPAGTQFDLVDAAADKLRPAHEELIRQAAQGEVLYHDDTRVRILDEVPVPEGHGDERTGLHTTGTVSRLGEHVIAIFTSGPQHAGENMSDLLEQRQPDLQPPVLMSDALSHNTPRVPAELEVVLTNCLTHGRRQFTDILEAFPDECRHVIRQLALVYKHDAQARDEGLDAQARLAFHQEKSEPVMAELQKWMESQLADHKTEPNSPLGKAINYFLKRWPRLTLFLRHPGAPLDNTVAERALKKSVLHRKNSLFYKTLHGAQVGDLYMSLIHTCELNKVNSFQYMTELQRHAAEVRADPAAWLPWNFHLQLRPAPD